MNSECIEWQGALNRGRGWMKRNGRPILAHRAAWEEVHGVIPKDQCVCHQCDNPRCINIEHLFLGTHIQNMADMREKKRAARLPGDLNPNCRIADERVAALRASYEADPRPFRQLAKDFGVSESLAWGIVKGRFR